MTTLLLKLFVKNYQKTDDPKVRKDYGLLGSFFGLITNLLLFVGKIIIGILLGLFSIVTDSMNNLSDFGNNFISIVGVKASAKKADREHPYGHQRMEYVLSLIISCIIIGLSMVMMYQGIRDMVAFFRSIVDTGLPPTQNLSYTMYVVSLYIMSVAILMKLMQACLYFSLGKKIDSMPLKALGKDARNDVISTIFVIIGIIITWFSHYSVDCFFTLVVAVFVCLSGVGIMKDAISALIGEEPSPEYVQRLITLIQSYPDVLGMHDLDLHCYGKVIYGVIHLEVDDRKDINESHEMIDEIERKAHAELGIHLTVHMDPIKVDDPLTENIKKIIRDSLASYSTTPISMHDFRIINHDENMHIAFELVIPDSLDNPKEQEKLTSYIRESIAKEYGDDKSFSLDIGFDSEVQDFLLGTSAEKKEQ